MSQKNLQKLFILDEINKRLQFLKPENKLAASYKCFVYFVWFLIDNEVIVSYTINGLRL